MVKSFSIDGNVKNQGHLDMFSLYACLRLRGFKVRWVRKGNAFNVYQNGEIIVRYKEI